MKKQTKIFMLFAMLFFAVGAFAQTRNVTGTVTDGDGEPVIAATVNVTGTDTRVLTDLDGSFSIQAPSDAETLTISFVGMDTQVVPIGSGVVNVTMANNDTALEGIVVTALGIERDKKALGYSTQQVGGEEVVDSNPTGFIEGLKGRVAGLQVNQSTGAAGSGTRIVLRGQKSLNGDNQPLIIVDGVRINNSEFNTEGRTAGVSGSNRGIDINPNDIESINVLKGASAAALYGYEAQQGAIIITTKKGNAGKASFEFRNNITFGQYSDIVNLQDQYSQGFGGDYAEPSTRFIPSAVSWGAPISSLYYDGNSDYKWDSRGAISTTPSGNPVAAINNVDNYFKTSTATNNGISVSGGTSVATYRASFDYLNEDGYVPENKFSRANASIASKASLLDNRLNLTSNFAYNNSKGNRIQQGSNISGVMLGLLRTPPTFDNSQGYQFAEDGTQRNFRGGGGYDNPYWVSYKTPYEDGVNRFVGSFSAGYDLFDFMTVTGRFGADTYSDVRTQQFEIGSRTSPAGSVIEDNYVFRKFEGTLNLGGKFDLNEDLGLTYNLGGNGFAERLENENVQGNGLAFVGFPSINISSNVSQNNYLGRERSAGLYYSMEFDYKDFLYVTTTGRNDWVSNLYSAGATPSDVSFFYPSASVSFLPSNLFDSKNIDFLKIRGSWAETAAGAPNIYLTATTFAAAAPADGWTNGLQFPFNGTSGFSYSDVLGNPNLTPEGSREFEIGFETGLFNMLEVDFAYYNRSTKDGQASIVSVPISSASGFDNIVINSGELTTSGIDAVVGFSPLHGKDFQWDLNTSFSTWNTTVDKLADGIENQFLGGFTGTGIYNIPGEEYGQIFGGKWLRDAQGNVLIGDDGFPLADPELGIIGNPNPDFLLGITNSFSYKNFDLSFLVDIKEGGDIWNGTKGALTFFGMSELTENRGTTKVFDGVVQSTGEVNSQEVTLDQNWYLGNGGGFGNVAEHFVEDGSFIKLRNARVGYNLSRSQVKSLPFENINFFVGGNNLIIISDFDGDPETSLLGNASNAQGLSYFELPGKRTYSAGLNFKF